ncbi:MAG: TlpA family protein disulfide reductase [Gammaproteobacteria bacterium]|nr:TlpA family protein disulfide reductase [Gammaproteobacteria bacterium]
MKKIAISLLAGLFFIPAVVLAVPAEQGFLELDDGTELSYLSLKAESKQIYLWLPVEFGSHAANEKVGRQFQQAGMHSWVLDLLAPYFLSITTSSLDKVPGVGVAALIEHAHKQTGKDVILVAAGRAALTAMRGARSWLEQHQDKEYFKGVVMLHPKLFIETPEAGVQPRYMPEIEANQLPVFMLIPTQSPGRWRAMDNMQALGLQGAPVFTKFIYGVRDFYFRNSHPNQVEVQKTEQLPSEVQLAGSLLASLPVEKVNRLAEIKKQVLKSAPSIRGIEDYAGTPPAPELIFKDTTGKTHQLSKYKGQVVLLNFWATWCPPCVHEMPSMDRLQQSFKDEPFSILAVNMAEEEEVVRTFLKRDVQVNFPVLLDTKGLALKDWDIFVYPTTYIIGKQGRIRAAMYGAIDWNSDKVKAQLRALMNE